MLASNVLGDGGVKESDLGKKCVEYVPSVEEINLWEVSIGKRPLLQFLENFQNGILRKSREENLFAPFAFQSEFLSSKKLNTWIIGANKSGKSQVCFIKTALTLLGFNKLIPAPNEGWIISMDWPATRGVSIPILFELLSRSDIKSWNKTEKELILINGSKATFKSADSGRAKFQGARLDWIQIDEEISEEVYREAKLRCKANKKLYIWGAALPFSGFDCWLYKDVYCKRLQSTTDVWTPTIYDNLSLHPEMIAEFEASYHGSERQIRLLGQFANLTGDSVFDIDRLEKIKKGFCCEPSFKGSLIQENGEYKIINDGIGFWQFWELPQKGRIYSIGVDVSSGEGKDYCCIQVLDGINEEQVAIFHGKVLEDTLSWEIEKAATYYNGADVIIEITGGYGKAVQNLLIKSYPNLYRRIYYDRFGVPDSYLLGWETKEDSKKILIVDGKQYLRDCGRIRDEGTVWELQCYIHHKDGKLGARSGTNDDRVIAFLLALRQIKEKGYKEEYDLAQMRKGTSPDIDFTVDIEKFKEGREQWLYL